MGYGLTGHVGISFQTSMGTVNASSYHWIPVINESITLSKNPIVSEGMRGRFESGDSWEGVNAVAGDIVTEVHPILVGKFLKAWFAQSSGALVTSHYDHTFNPRQVDWDTLCAVPPFTLEKYLAVGSAHQYRDCVVDQLSFEIAQGALIKMTASIIGGGYMTTVVKSTPTYLTGSEFTWDQCSLSIAGAGVDEIRDLTITFANNLEAYGTLNNTKYANRIKRGGFRTVEIGGTIFHEDDTHFTSFRNQTAQAMVLTIRGGECGSGYYNTLKFDFPRVKFREYPAALSGPTELEVGFTGDAYYHADSATMVTVTLTNTHTAY